MAKSLRSKEYDRITQQIRRAERRGYEFTDEFKQSLKSKTYEELHDIKVKDVYGSGMRYNPDTKQYQSGEIAREEEIEQQKAKRKRQYQSDEIPDLEQAALDEWYMTWGQYPDGKASGASFIISRTEALERKYGIGAVARAITKFMADNYVNLNKCAYEIQEATSLMNGIQNVLWEMTGATEDEIKQEQEEIANMTDNVPTEQLRFYSGSREK